MRTISLSARPRRRVRRPSSSAHSTRTWAAEAEAATAGAARGTTPTDTTLCRTSFIDGQQLSYSAAGYSNAGNGSGPTDGCVGQTVATSGWSSFSDRFLATPLTGTIWVSALVNLAEAQNIAIGLHSRLHRREQHLHRPQRRQSGHDELLLPAVQCAGHGQSQHDLSAAGRDQHQLQRQLRQSELLVQSEPLRRAERAGRADARRERPRRLRPRVPGRGRARGPQLHRRRFQPDRLDPHQQRPDVRLCECDQPGAGKRQSGGRLLQQ